MLYLSRFCRSDLAAVDVSVVVSVGHKQVATDILMFVSNVQLRRIGDAMQNAKKEIIFWLDVC